MGLALGLGVLADFIEHDEEAASWLDENIERLNECLVENGIDPHQEPRDLKELETRSSVISFPYSWTHYLRRVVANALADPAWKASPLAVGEDPCSDSTVLEATLDISSHFICHSDCEGFYVPKDFQDVLFGGDEISGGGIIGSSYRLLEELQQAAPALNITLNNGQLSDEEAAILNAVEEDDPLMIEKIVWLAFFESARLSVEHGTLLCFQ